MSLSVGSLTDGFPIVGFAPPQPGLADRLPHQSMAAPFELEICHLVPRPVGVNHLWNIHGDVLHVPIGHSSDRPEQTDWAMTPPVTIIVCLGTDLAFAVRV